MAPVLKMDMPLKPCGVKLDVTLSAGPTLSPGFCVDLGQGGMTLKTCRPIPEGTQVGLRFSLPGVGRVELLAQVVAQVRQPEHRTCLLTVGFQPYQAQLIPFYNWLDESVPILP